MSDAWKSKLRGWGDGHRSSPDDLFVIGCDQCGWSLPLSMDDKEKIGVPYYCHSCGQPAVSFLQYHPSEEEKAKEIIADAPRWEVSHV